MEFVEPALISLLDRLNELSETSKPQTRQEARKREKNLAKENSAISSLFEIHPLVRGGFLRAAPGLNTRFTSLHKGLRLEKCRSKIESSWFLWKA